MDVTFQNFLRDAVSYSGLIFLGTLGLRFQPLGLRDFYRISYSYLAMPWGSKAYLA